MKKTNIAFSGVMAAILIGAGAANAAPVKIASQQYVDTKVGDVSTTVSSLSGQVETLGTKLGSKLDATTADSTYEKVANKKGTIDSASPTASTDYPTVQAVVDYTAQELADVQFDPADISDGALSGSKITDGTISADKLDTALNAEIDGKQDKKMGVGHENHIVTTDATGTITSVATIAQSKVEGLETALAGKLESDDLTGYVTSESLTTTLGDYATTTALSAKQDKLTATGAANRPVYVNEQGVVTAGNTIPTVTTNITTGITDAAQAGAVADKLAQKEDAANKATSITGDNQSSPTAYPSVGAIVEWTNQKIADLSDTGLPVNPGNINDNSISGSKLENGAVITEKIADDAVTEDKLSNDVVAKIDGKADAADVYTKQETNDKIVEIAIRQPKNTCTAESQLCVLSLTKTGELAWVEVTDPVGDLPSGGTNIDEKVPVTGGQGGGM